MNDNTITEKELEELENIYPDIEQKLTPPTMKSGIMNVHHNNPDNFIEDSEDFCQYHSWLLREHEKKIQTSTTQISNAKLN